jgi:hypothetical protein
MLVYAPFLCVLLHFMSFYAFSETTYLEDATVLVPYFLQFLCFRKATREIFSELDEMKPEHPIFPGCETKSEGEPEGGQGPTTPGGGAPLPWSCQGWCGATGRPLTLPLLLYKAFQSQNPKSISIFPSKVLQCRHRWSPISRDISLCIGTLPGWGSALGAVSIDSIASTAVSIDFTAISINVAVSHDEEGVVLPQGWGLYQ